MPIGANLSQELEGLAIGAGEDVLSVVDEFAGLAIAKGRGASPEASALLEHEDAASTRGEAHGGTQTGESRADDDGVERFCGGCW